MKRLFKVIMVLITVSLIGCSNVNEDFTNNIKSPDVTSFKYKGTWVIKDFKHLTDDNINYDESINIKGELVKLSSDSIEIFNYVSNNIKYKLKVVNKDYIISYEHNIKAEEFMNGKETIDIISVIDNNNILCEFLMSDNGEIIALTNGMLLNLKKVSDDVNFTGTAIPNDNNSSLKNESTDVGVMLGLKTARKIQDDGTFSDEEYRTIWIPYKNNELDTVYEKDNIIFPRLDGMWNLSIVEKDINGKHYESFDVFSMDGRTLASSQQEVATNVYKSINFVGNDYIAIAKYEGDDFQNIYSVNQIIPVNNVNTNQGLSIEELFNNDAKIRYMEEFKIAYSSLSEVEQQNFDAVVDFTNIIMERNEGKWLLKGAISGKNNTIKEFELPLKPNNKLVNFNSLLIPWKNLKGEISFIKDAYSSPNGAIVVVQFKEYLAVYETDNNGLKGSPLISIPLKDGEKIIMAEWCEYGYVNQWDKVFVDGTIIE